MIDFTTRQIRAPLELIDSMHLPPFALGMVKLRVSEARAEARVGFVRLVPSRVIAARQALGLSREALAELAAGDISEATIKRAEGGRPVSLAKAKVLATLVSCDLALLLDGGRLEEPYLSRLAGSGLVEQEPRSQVLNGSPQRREPAQLLVPNASASEPVSSIELRHYHHVCEAEHGSLLLAGLATRLRVPLDLEDLYVPLHALLDLRGHGDAEFADANEAEACLADRTCEVPLEAAFREASERGCRALLILGDPGSGKTTYLKRLVLYCLRQGSEALGLPTDLLPVFLPIRDLGGASDLESFIDAQLIALHAVSAPGMAKRLLARGRLLLLFDGLDEVADESERSTIAGWIAQTVRARPTCVTVVTCRFAGYGRAVRFGADFMELHVRPLSGDQCEMFVRNWYRLVETALDPSPRLSIRHAHARQQANELIARLRSPERRSARLTALARNSLLLANICLIHRDRGTLPMGRARLYSECIQILLEHWRQAKGLPVELTAEAGCRVLQPVALWMHQRQKRRATSTELEPILARGLEAIGHTGTSREFLCAVRDGTGLLTGWSTDQFGFMHSSFQEFLAALELRRLAQDGEISAWNTLAEGYGKSWWQEVLLVVFALGDPSGFQELMRRVLAQPSFATQAELLELICDEAPELSELPFMELLKQAPGDDRELWCRQLTALRFLAARSRSCFELAVRDLAQHPCAALRSYIRDADALVARTRRSYVATTSMRGGVELVQIPHGAFVMGSPPSEPHRYADEGPEREVTLTPFLIGRYPVTNEEYGRFLIANPTVPEPAFWADARYRQQRQPVMGVSWIEATQFAEWAGARLPTEAEWEYACRAGTVGSRYAALAEVAWSGENSGMALRHVGLKRPNDWGLYDMLGNVWEWCSDWYGEYGSEPVSDPEGAASGTRRVVRGGAWYVVGEDVRAALRSGFAPEFRRGRIGFRIASTSRGS